MLIGQGIAFMDWNHAIEDRTIILLITLVMFIAIPLMILIFKMLHNLETKIRFQAVQTYQDMKTSHYMQEENLNVYKSLEEGIMTIQNDKIDFTNQIAEDIIMQFDRDSNEILNFEQIKDIILDQKIFKINKLSERLQ